MTPNRSKRKKRSKRVWVFAVILLLLSAAAAVGFLKWDDLSYAYTMRKELKQAQERADARRAELEAELNAFDQEAYYAEQFGQMNLFPMVPGTEMLSEGQMIQELGVRGFGESTVTTCYDSSGNLVDEMPLTAGNDTLHPAYDIIYTSPAGEQWAICFSRGVFSASPMEYLWTHPDRPTIFLTEGVSGIVFYDSASGQYRSLGPKEGATKILRVERIDASTLAQFTQGVLDGI